MIPYNQLSLADIFSDCQEIYESDKPQFLSLLQQHIDLDEIVPASFRKHFYASTGRSRKYPLNAFLWALIIQRIFSIPTDSLLLVFLHYSRHLREFCGFDKVPDASKITRFKQDFLEDLQTVFDHLVDLTEPICQVIDPGKAAMTVFDSSGIEAWVTENNPKYANRIIKQLKAYAKSMHFDENYDPYKAAYSSMPSHAAANSQIKQLYIDGHFCYAYKFGIVTNGLGIVRSINFYNKKFFDKHPEIIVNKKSDSPDDDKSVHDARLLIPTLQDLFPAHPLLNPHTFLGDAAFDSAKLYKVLLSGSTFGTGSGILVGNELGGGNLETARKYGRLLCRISLIAGAVSGLFILLSSPLVLMFTTSLTEQAHAYLQIMLYICSYYMIGKSINSTVVAGIFCAGGDTKFGFICDAVTMWIIMIPLGAFAAFILRLPILAVYFLLNLDELVKLPAVYRHYKQYKWVKNLTANQQ